MSVRVRPMVEPTSSSSVVVGREREREREMIDHVARKCPEREREEAVGVGWLREERVHDVDINSVVYFPSETQSQG